MKTSQRLAVGAACAGSRLLLLASCTSPRQGPTPDAGSVVPTAASPASGQVASTNTVESLAESALRSVVVISHYGRDGSADGIGAGFVVASNLIATSLHVIGEARPMAVHTGDGRRHEVTAVHAWDRKLDLAVLEVAARNLRALPLGDSDSLKQGATVIALGNPQGLEHSVVQGVVSARRDFDGVEMIQLAIPIEPGNSGGPLLDLHGRVHGLLTLKSAVTANLGFAMPVNALKPLLAKPNRVPISRWLTIGTLNPREWTPLFGSRWTQKAGRIQVEGAGKGFGGRSLCLSQREVPQGPFELSVTVKLDDEAGAAGLVFGADGGERHFGFYPTAGQLRLTRFDGPDVFNWQILGQVRSRAYRPGEWNTLKVRVESDRLLCYVNGELVIESASAELAGSKVGLAKFRNTSASFKEFKVGEQLETAPFPAEVAAQIRREIERLPGEGTVDPALLETLQHHAQASRAVLSERAGALEKQAGQLRKLAAAMHFKSIEQELLLVLNQPEEKIDLALAALLIARLDNEEVEVESYRQQLQQMAAEVKTKFPARADSTVRLKKLIEYLFTDCGFHGSRTDYYSRANSYLNEVMEDREGLPITLAVLFLHLAEAIELEHLSGVSLPGHFLVRYKPIQGEAQLIDLFEGGRFLTKEEVDLLLQEFEPGLRDAMLAPATKRAMIIRILRNLSGIAQRSESPESALHYYDLMLSLEPQSAHDRLSRGLLRARGGEIEGAREDLGWLMENRPPGIDLQRVAELLRSL